ncbi:pyridoxamine 5'-phosphate oxidase family protein [Candidatus Nitrosotenuis cloacae]|uniref:pyridoxamine 5'-phosphate oxidase family protein n=1 Tax=Candidatus Nitrosotenuis cloacae TaxID=1603555 RepID=UPI0022818DE5|nr:pyridoxamine 5'-phosphate oxidase family protein [Candidatus Nitrosotenuis cloacae]
MQLLGRLEIKSRQKIIDFLNEEHVGRIASIDKNGFPQVIPMNFVFANDAIYMHSHPRGEKIENIKQNSRVGFEVDRELEFLPSYFTHPTDASQADTLYISVVIKGTGVIISDNNEKAMALNALMEKYQPEGNYESLTAGMPVVEEVAVIKVVPHEMRGKYKVGQHMDKNARISLAENILRRNSDTARRTLKLMGFEVVENKVKMIEDPQW